MAKQRRYVVKVLDDDDGQSFSWRLIYEGPSFDLANRSISFAVQNKNIATLMFYENNKLVKSNIYE